MPPKIAEVGESIPNPTANRTLGRHRTPTFDEVNVSLRRFPYPYRAALAICSDIDGTKTANEFLEIQRFLCTKNVTRMGEGVGLEIGNSFSFYDQWGEFSYFTSDERTQHLIIDMIRAGYIDCLHSYGDRAESRDQILLALDVLCKADCKLEVWVNHYGAASNFGRKFGYMFGVCEGSDPGSAVYHTDVTLGYGIRFAWVGAITRLIGQSSVSSPRFSILLDPQYPFYSLISMAKETRKSILGFLGDKRYVLHHQNDLIGVMQLEDGQQLYEFIRYCDHPISVSQGATSRGLARAISGPALGHLKNVQGFMIVYTHLGKNHDCQQCIPAETQAALRNLEREHQNGEIYVTTTSKLLNYYHANKHIVWSHQQRGNRIQIHIEQVDDPVFGKYSPTVGQLQGLTFTVPDARNTDVFLQGVEIRDVHRNPVDDSGTESVTIPFNHLSFPY